MLRRQALPAIPPDTKRVAQAAFPKGHPYLRLADELGSVITDDTFAALFPPQGQPAFSPWRLALVTILQYAEGLSDRRAADAVRSRIDWKYVLRLELSDPGFDASILSEFRTRLIAGGAETLLLETLLTWCRERQLLTARGRQRTDSTHVLAAVRALNRVELAAETMRHALNRLAVIAPEWLRSISEPTWLERYSRRAEDDRQGTSEAREALARTIGADGYALLAAVYAPTAPPWVAHVPAVEMLRQIWVQQFYWDGDTVHWRTEQLGTPPSTLFLSSPYDSEAHYAKKSITQWVGYKVHLTETCEDDLPHRVTHVETTPGPIADGAATPLIHTALQDQALLPSLHLVDTGYLDAALLVASRREYAVELLGPTRPNCHWQARAAEGFAIEHFQIDWDREQATCPEGHTSLSWTPAIDNRHSPVIKIKFSSRACRPCVSRSRCFHSGKRYARRSLTVRPQEQHEALQAARQREQTEDFRAVYAKRAGVEGTLSRGIRTCRLRRTRYIGLRKTRLAHLLTAVALNFLRLGEWFAGVPPAQTRHFPFVELMADRLVA
jgi:transposase